MSWGQSKTQSALAEGEVYLVSARGAKLAIAQFDINLTPWDVFWSNCLQGFGIGVIYVPLPLLQLIQKRGLVGGRR